MKIVVKCVEKLRHEKRNCFVYVLTIRVNGACCEPGKKCIWPIKFSQRHVLTGIGV